MSTQSVSAINVRGVVIRELGNWRNASIDMLPVGAPGPGEVLIAPEACALNFQDLLLIDGKYQYRPPLPCFAGRDVAGKIVAVDPGVSEFRVGDRVAAQVRHGAFAELVLAPVGRCYRIPQAVDGIKAAAAGTIFATVAVALGMRARVRRGERVLVTGATGGVGTAAVQYAKHLGAEVVALVSTASKADAVKTLGVSEVVRLDQIPEPSALRDTLAAHCIELVDIVLDVTGGDVFDASIRCLRPGGRVVVVGFASGRIATVKTNYLLLKEMSVIGSSLENVIERNDPVLRELMTAIYDEIAVGRFDPMVTAAYPLSEFHRAAEQITGRTAIGKIALLPS
jgi:NADPH2:quinone reductase